MICDDCKYNLGYTLGHDECGAGNYMSYCGKGHWEGASNEPQTKEQSETMGVDYWADCEDYEQAETNKF